MFKVKMTIGFVLSGRTFANIYIIQFVFEILFKLTKKKKNSRSMVKVISELLICFIMLKICHFIESPKKQMNFVLKT